MGVEGAEQDLDLDVSQDVRIDIMNEWLEGQDLPPLAEDGFCHGDAMLQSLYVHLGKGQHYETLSRKIANLEYGELENLQENSKNYVALSKDYRAFLRENPGLKDDTQTLSQFCPPLSVEMHQQHHDYLDILTYFENILIIYQPNDLFPNLTQADTANIYNFILNKSRGFDEDNKKMIPIEKGKEGELFESQFSFGFMFEDENEVKYILDSMASHCDHDKIIQVSARRHTVSITMTTNTEGEVSYHFFDSNNEKGVKRNLTSEELSRHLVHIQSYTGTLSFNIIDYNKNNIQSISKRTLYEGIKDIRAKQFIGAADTPFYLDRNTIVESMALCFDNVSTMKIDEVLSTFSDLIEMAAPEERDMLINDYMSNGNTLLLAAIYNIKIDLKMMSYLQRHNVDFNICERVTGMHPLEYAMEEGGYKKCQILLKYCDKYHPRALSMLYIAENLGYKYMKLLTRSEDGSIDKAYLSKMQYDANKLKILAQENDDLELMDVLEQMIKRTESIREEPVDSICEQIGRQDILLNHLNHDYEHLLDVFYENDDIEIFCELLKAGSNVSNILDAEEYLQWAVKSGSVEAVGAILEKFCLVTPNNISELVVLAPEEQKLDLNSVLESQVEEGEYLHKKIAIDGKIPDEYLTTKSQYLDYVDKDGNTPLMLICQSRKLHSIYGLLSKIGLSKFNVNAKNTDGKTALMIAIEEKQGIPELFLMDADLSVENNDGFTALMVAIQLKNSSRVKILLKADAPLNMEAGGLSVEAIELAMKVATRYKLTEKVELLNEYKQKYHALSFDNQQAENSSESTLESTNKAVDVQMYPKRNIQNRFNRHIRMSTELDVIANQMNPPDGYINQLQNIQAEQKEIINTIQEKLDSLDDPLTFLDKNEVKRMTDTLVEINKRYGEKVKEAKKGALLQNRWARLTKIGENIISKISDLEISSFNDIQIKIKEVGMLEADIRAMMSMYIRNPDLETHDELREWMNDLVESRQDLQNTVEEAKQIQNKENRKTRGSTSLFGMAKSHHSNVNEKILPEKPLVPRKEAPLQPKKPKLK